jgi:hypothetical protein
MTDEILKLNANNELIAEDPDTGNVRPVQVADLSASGDVSATNVTADTQMNSSSTRPDVFADTVDANNVAGARQGCRVFLSSDQNISADILTKIQFDSEVYDSDNNFNTSSHDWTCPKDGLYSVNLQVRFQGGGNDEDRRVAIGAATDKTPLNEGAFIAHGSSDSGDRISASTINKYNSGDTIAGYAENRNSDDTLSSGPANIRTFFEVAFLGGL